MTTNVYDKGAARLASDSRWSAITPCERFMLYTDDAKFDKIFVCDNTRLAFAFAGEANYVEMFKNWLTDGMMNGEPEPESPREAKFTYCAVNIDTGLVVKMHFPAKYPAKVVGSGAAKAGDDVDAVFAGSGAEAAYSCWMITQDPIEAITVAMEEDSLTGGDIVSTCLRSQVHNASAGSAAQLLEALLKGTVMEKVSQTKYTNPLPLGEMMGNPLVAALVVNLKAGSAVASAPFPGMGEAVYTDQQLKEHKDFMASLRARATS